MIQRFCPAASRLNENVEILLGLGLTDVLLQRVGAQGKLPAVLRLEGSGHQGILKNIVSEIYTHKNTVQLSDYFSIFFSVCRMISSTGRAAFTPFSAAEIS